MILRYMFLRFKHYNVHYFKLEKDKLDISLLGISLEKKLNCSINCLSSISLA